MIDHLITALNKEVDLSAEEIADTLWLAMHMEQSDTGISSSQTSKLDSETTEEKSNQGSEPEISHKSEPTTSTPQQKSSKKQQKEKKAGLYNQKPDKSQKSLDISFKVPDAPSLREQLDLARALRPLMRRIPSGSNLVLDEAATTQRIADEGIWLPILRPTLEPWLDLELVVEEGISMQIWRHTIKELERLLTNYGIFRDVRVWGLISNEQNKIQIRRGIGTTAKNQPARSAAELIDSSGRRLVLVVSDCVSDLWRNGDVNSALKTWANNVPTAIIQMLPKWLWARTALGWATEVRFQGLAPAVSNRQLIANTVSLWSEIDEATGIKVPVFTLERDRVANWAQMLVGKGSIQSSGYVFKPEARNLGRDKPFVNFSQGELTAKQRVQAFRVTASPMARKLAGLLASAPVISLPVVRLIQETMLKDSQQVHVAEVFLGGLLKPLSEIEVDTAPDYVQYGFIDGVRELLIDSVPSSYVLNVVEEVSKFVAKKVGLSLADFAAVLRNPDQISDSKVVEQIQPFAMVTVQILRCLGGEYEKVANKLVFYTPLETMFIPNNEIGLVIANQGEPLPLGRTLGKVVECNNFQDTEAFLKNGGQRGRQSGILTAGEYRINSNFFKVITSDTATKYGMNPEDLKVYEIPLDTIGIVITKDGKTIPAGEIAGIPIKGHNQFQDPQQFISLGGYKGLQEEILLPGSWNLNPWFVKVEQAPLTKIEPGQVGVVVSYVGKNSLNNDNDLVDEGYKGVWKKPLYPGKYPINTRIMDVVIIPTHQITLDWSNREKPPNNYDANLRALKLRSQDGFAFYIELTQVISISAENAPKMISRIGSPATRKLKSTDDIEAGVLKFTSIRNLITRVLEPMIRNYFRNSAQNYEALQFHEQRSLRQQDAIDYIKPMLEDYGVNSVGTFINEIDLPDELEQILTERKIHQEGIETDKFRHYRELKEKQAQIIIDKLQVDANLYYKKREIEILGGFQNYLAKLRTEQLPQIKLPNVLVGSNGDQFGLLEAFIAPMLDDSTSQPLLSNSSQPQIPTGDTTSIPQPEVSFPRCPIILLLDTSISLSNEYLEGLVEGINTFEQQLSKDKVASRCIEVAIITFGNSAKVVQPFNNAGNFALGELELCGDAATGKALELALKIIKHRQVIYNSQNIQHYQPWIFLITGSNPNDNWQGAVKQVKQAVANQKLNFLTIGVENADMKFLTQIAPPKFPPTRLEGLKFKPLFYGLAHLMKRIAHRQEKESLLEGLANAVEQAKSSSLPPEQAEALVEYTAKLMSEVSKEKPSRQEYISTVVELMKTARQIGDNGKSITEIVPDITKTLGF